MGKRRARKEERAPVATESPKWASLRSSRRWLLASLLLFALLTIALSWLRAKRGHALRRDPGLSVLLITIDTLRADALGAYGQTGAATPWIDRLAREGVRFERAHAHNVVTL